jgi:hypothetical protein
MLMELCANKDVRIKRSKGEPCLIIFKGVTAPGLGLFLKKKNYTAIIRPFVRLSLLLCFRNSSQTL